MHEIKFDFHLRPEEIRGNNSVEDLVRAIKIPTGVTSKWGEAECVTADSFGDLINAVMPKNTQYYHRNYMEYLRLCWSYHRGVIISPTILWNLFLNELATEVKDNAENYRSIFTTATKEEGKTQVTIRQLHPTILDVESMCNALKQHIPSEIDAFIPKFSTDSDNSKVALHATFLDVVSSYYEYSFTCCGIPKIKILGTEEDWNSFVGSLQRIKTILGDNITPEFAGYIDRVMSRIVKIYFTVTEFLDTEKDYFEDFFDINMCGSGHPDELRGWVLDFFMDNSSKALAEYPSIVASIDYSDDSYVDPIKYKMLTGLFGSVEDEDNYLIPDYGYLIYLDLVS